MKLNKILAVAALSVVVLAGCGGTPTATSPAPTVTVTQQAAPTTPAETPTYAPYEEMPSEKPTTSEEDYALILNLTWSDMSADSKKQICVGWNNLGIKDELIDSFYSESGDMHPSRAQMTAFFDSKCA